jgi:hypothetical protein
MSSEVDFTMETRRDKVAEVQAFVRLYGYSIDAACELVGLERRYYRHFNTSQITYLPTPEIIRYECARIRRFGLNHQARISVSDISRDHAQDRFRDAYE